MKQVDEKINEPQRLEIPGSSLWLAINWMMNHEPKYLPPNIHKSTKKNLQQKNSSPEISANVGKSNRWMQLLAVDDIIFPL